MKRRVSIEELYEKFTSKKILLILSLIFALMILTLVATFIGAANLSFERVWRALLPFSNSSDWQANVIVWEWRLPRIFMAIIAGAGLAIAGAVIQATLRNPLASPYTLGVSAAAGFGAALAMVLGVSVVGGKYLVVANAFCFALLATLLVCGISRAKGMGPETTILVGIAVMYMFSAFNSILQYIAEPGVLQSVVFWLMGGLHTASWGNALPVLVVTLLCVLPLIRHSWDLNAMAAGDETAMSLGVNVKLVRALCLVLASLITASIVCFTGTIGFICLVSPHITRILVGGDNRFVLPCSCLVGAILLLGSDTVARTIIAPTEIPVGVMTSFIGVPFFIYLLMRGRRGYWQ